MRRIESSGSAKIISLDVGVLLDELGDIARRIIEQNSEVKEIFLIGSIARGDYTGFSDADVLIILHRSSQDAVKRIRSYLPYFDLPIGVDLLIFTEQEFKDMAETANPFVERVIRERQRLA